MSWEETARQALLIERDKLRAENERMRRALRLTESVLVLVPEIDPALLAQVRAALAKEAGQ
jgi:hypothetical protein